MEKITKHFQQVKVADLFNEIVLTEEEKSLVIREAENKKFKRNEEPLTDEEKDMALMEERKRISCRKKLLEYSGKVMSIEEKKYPKPTAEELYDKLLKAPGFVQDEFNKDINWNICLYFAGDKRSNYDLKKGLYLYGPAGCGKTSLMRFFRHNPYGSFSIFSVREISEAYARNGVEGVHRFKNMIKTASPELNYGQKELGICFDDLGTEVDKKHFGNESNVMAEILLNRYDRIKTLAAKTHVTSNLNTTQIEERYGYRVRSRCREMFNIVAFEDNSTDRRK